MVLVLSKRNVCLVRTSSCACTSAAWSEAIPPSESFSWPFLMSLGNDCSWTVDLHGKVGLWCKLALCEVVGSLEYNTVQVMYVIYTIPDQSCVFLTS